MADNNEAVLANINIVDYDLTPGVKVPSSSCESTVVENLGPKGLKAFVNPAYDVCGECFIKEDCDEKKVGGGISL